MLTKQLWQRLHLLHFRSNHSQEQSTRTRRWFGGLPDGDQFVYLFLFVAKYYVAREQPAFYNAFIKLVLAAQQVAATYGRYAVCHRCDRSCERRNRNRCCRDCSAEPCSSTRPSKWCLFVWTASFTVTKWMLKCWEGLSKKACKRAISQKNEKKENINKKKEKTGRLFGLALSLDGKWKQREPTHVGSLTRVRQPDRQSQQEVFHLMQTQLNPGRKWKRMRRTCFILCPINISLHLQKV